MDDLIEAVQDECSPETMAGLHQLVADINVAVERNDPIQSVMLMIYDWWKQHKDIDMPMTLGQVAWDLIAAYSEEDEPD